MFGRNKQSSVVSVDTLTRAAWATIETALMRHYGVGLGAWAGADESKTTRAAAAANLLNGQARQPTVIGVDLRQIQAETREWIRTNVEMRELVVQTLRVVAQSAGTRDGAMSEESLAILSEFSGDATDTPDPLAYEAVVRRAIATLPHSTQVRLMRLTKANDV